MDIAAARPVRWPWIVLSAFVLVALYGLALVVANGESVAAQIPYVIAFTMFGVVGALISSRDRGNVIGLMLLSSAVITACSFIGGEATTLLIRSGHEGPDVVFLALMNNFGWLFGILPVVFLLPLLFPDGHLPSRRWRPFPWVVAAFVLLISVTFIFGQRTLAGSSDADVISNPLYVDAIGRLPSLDPVLAVAFPVLFAVSLLSLLLRFRRSVGDERQQIKWVAFGLSLAFVGITISGFMTDSVVSALIGGAAFLAFPLSIGVSVLRFRLYDLDVVVKKALVASAFALAVIAVYALVVGLLGIVASGQESPGVLFIVALLLGLAFRPVARFARRIADRVVYGRRATPYEVLTEFSGRIGDAYATEDVLGRMAQVLGEATGSERARVWLLVGGRLVPAAVWPTEAGLGEAQPIRDEPVGVPGESAVEVSEAGEVLGALSVAMPANDPMTPAKERLIRDLASQAGLVLRNVRLVEELRATHRRLVTAQDQERRRLERNIHDGAQQQLVALSVKTRLARDLTPRDPARAAEMLTQVDGEIQTALEDLRDLARGIYPPLLADKGLGAALDAQARRSPVPISVRADGIGRYPPEIEAAVYFSCLEALQNVAKYAEASSATVTIAQSDGDLTFEVQDDGRGFDTRSTAFGTGLQGISDRLVALHGELAIRSRPGTGTHVRGRVEVGG